MCLRIDDCDRTDTVALLCPCSLTTAVSLHVPLAGQSPLSLAKIVRVKRVVGDFGAIPDGFQVNHLLSDFGAGQWLGAAKAVG